MIVFVLLYYWKVVHPTRFLLVIAGLFCFFIVAAFIVKRFACLTQKMHKYYAATAQSKPPPPIEASNEQQLIVHTDHTGLLLRDFVILSLNSQLSTSSVMLFLFANI